MRSALALLFAALATAGLRAQAPAAPAPDRDQAATAPAIDATRLGVSMDRIRKGLRASEVRELRTDSPLRLEYQVQVFGTAPVIDAIGDFDIRSSAPIPYGAPTHADFLRQVTPQAYRSPRIPISSMAGWALFQIATRSAKAKCEEEIAEYRALVMQGVPVAAPRCTQ
jgi:hypothetical protein